MLARQNLFDASRIDSGDDGDLSDRVGIKFAFFQAHWRSFLRCIGCTTRPTALPVCGMTGRTELQESFWARLGAELGEPIGPEARVYVRGRVETGRLDPEDDKAVVKAIRFVQPREDVLPLPSRTHSRE